jgi:hypothetical protein
MVQSVLLGHPIHALSYTIPLLPTAPSQKRKLPEMDSSVQDNPAALTLVSIEIDTLEQQQTEKIETEVKDVDRIRITKVYASCPVVGS